jgi:hypothetical protein
MTAYLLWDTVKLRQKLLKQIREATAFRDEFLRRTKSSVKAKSSERNPIQAAKE